MTLAPLDSFQSLKTLTVGDNSFRYASLEDASHHGLGNVERLPKSLKILLENLIRHEDGNSVCAQDIHSLAQWLENGRSKHEIAFRPARILMQDFTGVPAVVDLAAMRQAMDVMGGNPERINPLSPVDLVIDHSVMVDEYATPGAFDANVEHEFSRNAERYAFLRWGQQSFENFRVVPPGTGICHQVNLEYLAQAVWTKETSDGVWAFPDTLIGTDSHTTMINGLGVLGWGVGGVEAEAAMLGQPVSMLIPEVIGFKLSGQLPEGTTATDLVLTITQMLRTKGVVGKFVEFYGPGLAAISLADRATIANMAPEYGATCGFFPIDAETCRYLTFTGRDPDRVALVTAYAKAQGLWSEDGDTQPVFTDTLALDLETVEPSLAGPKRPQDKIRLSQAATAHKRLLTEQGVDNPHPGIPVDGNRFSLSHGDVVIAAITSCTNTSNPSVMLAAGLLARNAVAKGLKTKPWVKTSLAPGSQVVTDYLDAAGVKESLDSLGFCLVGYGCTTCIGNSGPLDAEIETAIQDHQLSVCSVLSGNRNFEGRVHPLTTANYLASPPLVVAYALAGTMTLDLRNDPLGLDKAGQAVYLKDIWPSNQAIREAVDTVVTPEMYQNRYADVFKGPRQWQDIPVRQGTTYHWSGPSTYVKHPPFFEDMAPAPQPISDITAARPLAILADSVTTDHISPAGAIKKASPAGTYLTEHGVATLDFNSFGARRGNHEVMMRGTFGNIRIRNEMTPDTQGGVTIHYPGNTQMSIFEAAMRYKQENVPLIVIAGQEYGTGSSRDWAAKGTQLLGVKAVLVESFERIHRSNLIGMGVLPLQFPSNLNRHTLDLKGDETFDINGLTNGITAHMPVRVTVHRSNGKTEAFEAICRIDTANEVDYYIHGGILPYVLRHLLDQAA